RSNPRLGERLFGAKNMAFDPPLGSTSPAVLLDNATRLDELVNGPAGTVNDRAGQPLDSWRLMLQTFAAIIEISRKNLNPSGKTIYRPVESPGGYGKHS
ncbi:hypothetical protein V6S19_00610, partial [Klebsiella pneumoniae]